MQNNLIIEMPRQRKQTARYGNQDLMDLSEEEYDSEDEDDETQRGRSKRGTRGSRRGRRNRDDFYDPDDEGSGLYTRSELFKVEKNVLVYGYVTLNIS